MSASSRQNSRWIARQRGAALLTVLVMVALLGLAAGMAGQSLSALVQYEREAELLWRGQQYRQAIASYYNLKGGPRQMYPAKLEDLLKDPRTPGTVRHLRRLYSDPMTGKEWELVKDPAEKLIGVRSTSELKPFRQVGFPDGLENLEGKGTYREWDFVYLPPKEEAKGQGAPGAGQGSPPKPRDALHGKPSP